MQKEKGAAPLYMGKTAVATFCRLLSVDLKILHPSQRCIGFIMRNTYATCTQHAMVRACCVCVAYDKTHATLQMWTNFYLIQNYQQNRPNPVAKHQKLLQALRYCPTPDREAFNHKILRLQIQPARHPQMRPQHHVQPLTNPQRTRPRAT